LNALADLKVKTVAVLGGPLAVAESVVSQLRATPTTNAAGGNLAVGRAAGADRYQTAAMAAEYVPQTFVRVLNGAPTALIARGDDFPDALAAGPLADAAHMPLILTNPDSLSSFAQGALQTLHIKSAIILGGPIAVSAATEQAIRALGITTQRLAGATRQQTATAIAGYAITNLGFSPATIDLARGDAYPDALSGGPQAGQAGPAPILLTASPSALGADATAFITTAIKQLGEIDVLGLQSAISDGVLAEISALFSPTGPTTTTSTPSGVLPGLNVPGLGSLLGLLSPTQQQSLLPALSSLPSSVLDLMGSLGQAVPAAQVPAVGGLLSQPSGVVSSLTALVPALPSGGLTNLGGVLTSLPVGQVGPTGQLLSGLPVGSVGSLSSLLTSLPASQQGQVGSLLSAASPAQLPVIGQVLGLVSGGGGGLLGLLLGQLSGLPGANVLTSLSPANAGTLNSLLGALSPAQASLLGGVLSGLGTTPAGVLGTFLGSLGSGGAANLGGLLNALPAGQSGPAGAVLSALTLQGATSLANLLTGTPAGSIPAVAQVLSALP
jgi:hypothetical protein